MLRQTSPYQRQWRKTWLSYLRHFGVSIWILSATETQAGRLTCEGIFG